MKHCILIIAHNNFKQLQLLLSVLDDNRFDIYIHLDKKVKLIPKLTCVNSQLHILSNRIDVRWGDFSQVQAEMELFQTAFNNGPYQIYHLISGVDFPVHSIDYIHRFIVNHPNKEFVGFSNDPKIQYENRILKYHLFTKYYKVSNFIGSRILFHIRNYMERIINFFIKRNVDFELKKGANWVSITNEFCEYLLSKKDFIHKYFNHSYCVDEIYKQTLLWNSPFKNRLFCSTDEMEGCMRLIDWNRGLPYIWGENPNKDMEQVKNSSRLFVRKIDLNKYPEFVRVLCKYLKNE